MVNGQWSMVSGQCSVLSAQWSVVSGQWSVLSGDVDGGVIIQVASVGPERLLKTSDAPGARPPGVERLVSYQNA